SEVVRAKAKLEAGGTVEYTVRLFSEGKKPEQIAQERGLALSTIYGHLAQGIASGKLNVEDVVPLEARRQIEQAIQKVGSTQALSPIKALLPEEITYDMIRCVLAASRTQTSEVWDELILENDLLRKTESGNLVLGQSPSSLSTAAKKDIDAISSFLASPHPRPLHGNWNVGFALDFHSAYQGAEWNRSGVGELVYRLKYESDASVLPKLIEHVRNLFAAHPEMSQFDLIVPVPSSTPRKFNPVYEFCQALSHVLNKPMRPCLVKTRQTRPQKEMKTLPQKRDNVAGAFAVDGDISGRSILLVDDLFDSGATLEEITKVLFQHKAARVNVLSFTKTIHTDA
ncbi:MAG: helix-turn-helix domain-containing protein, partial [Anaerolineales bacterium]